MNMIDSKNNNAYIIAVVAKTLEKDDVKFYLSIKKQILNVRVFICIVFLPFKVFLMLQISTIVSVLIYNFVYGVYPYIFIPFE